MIVDGITRGVYTPTTNIAIKNLKMFSDFLYRNVKDHVKYVKMLPTSNTTIWYRKNPNFDSPDIITTEQLKFWPYIT